MDGFGSGESWREGGGVEGCAGARHSLTVRVHAPITTPTCPAVLPRMRLSAARPGHDYSGLLGQSHLCVDKRRT